MEHLELLRWLSTTDLDLLDHGHTLNFIRSAVESLRCLSDSDFESAEIRVHMLTVLEEILQELQQGGLPQSELAAFSKRFSNQLPEDEPATVRLERDLRTLAAELPEDTWCTTNYLMVEEGVDIYLDEGDDGPLGIALDAMADILEKAYKPYRELQVLDSEVTAESYVGHRLLQDGIEMWLDALEILRQEDDDSEETWSHALEVAEQGNRLLVAVQLFNASLQSQVRSSRTG